MLIVGNVWHLVKLVGIDSRELIVHTIVVYMVGGGTNHTLEPNDVEHTLIRCSCW
jgi:hypothetical protein